METQISDQPRVPRWVLRVAVLGSIAVMLGTATPPGAAAAEEVQRFLAFYAGVLTLLTMTTAVVSGLIATERMVLGIRQRILAQAVHRASSALAFMLVITHFTVKVLMLHVIPVQIVVPFEGPIGLGAIAFDLMLVLLITGLLRARFARAGRPWMWRAMHSVAYIAWPLAVVHGLTAGRPAAGWVVLSYVLCGGAVALALATRLIVTVKPRRAPHTVHDPLIVTTAAGAAPARESQQQTAARSEVVR